MPVQQIKTYDPETAGNPVFEGGYADPEGIIYGNQYWIYPTYSALFDEQVFMDAFSSPNRYTGQNMKELSIPQR